MNDQSNWRSFLENRFVLCVGCGAVTSLLLYLGKLDPGSYTAIIMGTVGAYVAGGVLDRKVAPPATPGQ